MDGWIDGWIDGWMDGWIDGWIDGWSLHDDNFHSQWGNSSWNLRA